MSSWGSYPSIFAMGHRAINDLLNHEVNVEEKVDGSQFSFGIFPTDESDPGTTYYIGDDLNLRIRSKGAVMHPEAPEKMFTQAAEAVKNIAHLLQSGWTYRAEYLARPKHNTLAYERVPKNHLILFDVNTGNQEYLSYEDKAIEAYRLGFECVPLLFSGKIGSIDQFRTFLDKVSILGGQNIEGVVVKPKNYDLFGWDKKLLIGKFVSEHFKEVHRKSWAENNPSTKDIIGLIGDMYRTPARWEKSIIHLREKGLIEDDPRDIGKIIKDVPEDVLKECKEDIMEALFKFAWPHIRRGLTSGLPEWYKERLLKQSFENQTNEGDERPSGESVNALRDNRVSDSDDSGDHSVVEV